MLKAVLVMLCFYVSISLAGNKTPQLAIQEYFNIQSKLDSVLRTYINNKDSEGNAKRYRIALKKFYEETTRGGLLREVLSRINQSDLASCASLASPDKPTIILKEKIILSNDSLVVVSYDFEEEYLYNDLFPGAKTSDKKLVVIPARMFIRVKNIFGNWLVEDHSFEYPQKKNIPAVLAGKE